MKKLSKLMALLLSLLMILSLFAACGDDKKEDKTEEETLTGKELLIGDWEVDYIYEAETTPLKFCFNKDGIVNVSFDNENYEEFIEIMVENKMTEVTEEDLAEAGLTSIEEAEEVLRKNLTSLYPYENIAAKYNVSGIWEFEDKILLITFDGGGEVYGETELDTGKTTFELYNDGNEEEGKLIFTKAK